MKKFCVGLLLTCCCGLTSCFTDDGDVLVSEPSSGSIVITETQSFQAQVFLDYDPTGKTTPTVLENVPVGTHVIHVFLKEYEADPDSFVVEVEDGQQTNLEFTLQKQASGDLEVTTQPDSAVVRIDRLFFGYTPVTIPGLVEGNYTLTLSRGGYESITRNVNIAANQLTEINETLAPKKVVLIEHYSNSGCAPCPDADEIIESVLEELGVQGVVSIGFHPYFPDIGDPMYQANEEHVDLWYGDRTGNPGFYGPQQPLPYVKIDGVSSFVGLAQITEQNLSLDIIGRSQLAPVATLAILGFVKSDSVITGTVRVEALENLGSQTSLRIALIEREIVFDQPPGTNGQSRFIDVFRAFYPDPEGLPISLGAGGKQFESLNFVVQPEWLVSETEVVAFLQDDDSKQVLQAVWTIFP